MNIMQYSRPKNYYTAVNDVKVYFDYTNGRLKFIDYQGIDESVLKTAIKLAVKEGLGKIIANCPGYLLQTFINQGFVIEGIINGYYKGENAFCVSCFIEPERPVVLEQETEDAILHRCMSETKSFLPEKHYHTIRKADCKDIPDMIKLFSSIFASYPSPVFDKEYLKKAMRERVLFKLIEADGHILGIASADMDQANLNAEITDCATYPQHRGKGILQKIIYSLESDLKKKGFLNVYSLARAVNPGINTALSRLGYKYGGRLVNNCHICGGFEDMNIWVKNLT